MYKKTCLLVFCFIAVISWGQGSLDKLTVEKIMRDPKWIGTSPSSPQWAADGKTFSLTGILKMLLADSLYYISLDNKTPVKATC